LNHAKAVPYVNRPAAAEQFYRLFSRAHSTDFPLQAELPYKLSTKLLRLRFAFFSRSENIFNRVIHRLSLRQDRQEERKTAVRVE